VPEIVSRLSPIIKEDVDYLVEDNAMDDICLSPEFGWNPWYAHF
jgi:hypothetical protein